MIGICLHASFRQTKIDIFSDITKMYFTHAREMLRGFSSISLVLVALSYGAGWACRSCLMRLFFVLRADVLRPSRAN